VLLSINGSATGVVCTSPRADPATASLPPAPLDACETRTTRRSQSPGSVNSNPKVYFQSRRSRTALAACRSERFSTASEASSPWYGRGAPCGYLGPGRGAPDTGLPARHTRIMPCGYPGAGPERAGTLDDTFHSTPIRTHLPLALTVPEREGYSGPGLSARSLFPCSISLCISCDLLKPAAKLTTLALTAQKWSFPVGLRTRSNQN
jgi:hypothetical protein